MLKILTKKDKELLQRRGYIYEHLLCLYSVVSDTTALYEDAFPVFVNSYGEADVVLFSLGPKKKDRLKGCVSTALDPLPARLDTDQSDALIGQKRVEKTDRVRPTADAYRLDSSEG